MTANIDLSYTPQQVDVFFGIEPGTRFVIVTKGRRFGLTHGAAHAFIEHGIEGLPMMWGDTVNSNIDRYVERFFKPALQANKIRYGYNSQKKQLVFEDTGGWVDFRSADRPENWEGFSYKRIFLNEAGIILKNDYLYTNAVLPMLMDYPDSVMIAGGVPKGKATTKGEHRFYTLYKNAMAGLPGYKIHHFTSYDNPILTKEDVDALATEIRRMNPAMERQEIYGEFVDGAGGLLWDAVLIERQRVKAHPDLIRIVVAVDPAITAKKDSDETGITVQGKDANGKAYVLEDVSGTYTPNQWGAIAAQMAVKWDADCIVGEKNQGGDMVEAVIRQHDKTIRVKLVTATKGKYTRAEPVYSLYEQGKVFHVGFHPELEAQMVAFNPEAYSPDRVDALVWGMTELMLGTSGGWLAY